MTRHLFMVDRYDEHGDVEAEPVVAHLNGGTLRLELDDGVLLDIEVQDLAVALALEEIKAA